MTVQKTEQFARWAIAWDLGLLADAVKSEAGRVLTGYGVGRRQYIAYSPFSLV